MQVFIPNEVAKHATNKYLGVLVAAKFARVLNEFPRDRSAPGEKKLTTRALEDLTAHGIARKVSRGEGNKADTWSLTPWARERVTHVPEVSEGLGEACVPEVSDGVMDSSSKQEHAYDDIPGTQNGASPDFDGPGPG